MPESDIAPENAPAPAVRRAAWILVIIMTVLVVLALIGVVWGFVRQGQILLQHRAQQAPQGAAPGPDGGIVLPPGTKIISSSTDAGRLVLRLQTAQGEEIRIIDLTNGRLVQSIKTGP